MLAEFGQPGVENPAVIDLITADADGETVILVMIERRPWGASAQQFKQIEEKVNRYMGYALDGFLVEHYPQHREKQVRIRLDCAEEPQGEAAKFVAAMEQTIERYGMQFAMQLLPPPS